MFWIRDRVKSGEFLAGTFLNLGSALTAELAAQAGFDFLVLDCEHGSGDHESLLLQLLAVGRTQAAPIVRITWNEAPRFKRALDLGASGIMVPYVNTEEEARQAAAAMRYPPDGVRGVAGWNRACGFGTRVMDYIGTANDNVLTIVQIETTEAVANCEAIAGVQGVDSLFIGPTDLSFSMGIPRQIDHPLMIEAYGKVVAACRKHGKAAGILNMKPEELAQNVERGFTLIAMGSDGALVSRGFLDVAAAFEPFKKGSA